MYNDIPKHDSLLKPSTPRCLEKQRPHVLGTSLQGYLFNAVQSGAPEHTAGRWEEKIEERGDGKRRGERGRGEGRWKEERGEGKRKTSE